MSGNFFGVIGLWWGLIAIGGGDPCRARENLEELRPTCVTRSKVLVNRCPLTGWSALRASSLPAPNEKGRDPNGNAQTRVLTILLKSLKG